MLTDEASVALFDREAACGPAVAFELLESRVLLSGDPLGLIAPAITTTPGPVGPPTPAPISADVQELVQGNNAFAFDLYQALRTTQGSLFFSPFSISAALSMAYAGAAGDTAQQMAEVLHITLPSLLHEAAFGSLMKILTTSQAASPAGDPGFGSPGDPFTLKIANSLWGQPNFKFLDDFLTTLAQDYDSPLRLTDFIADPEAARVQINQWVSDQTMGNIPDLIPAGAITNLTRLVLANAIYFKGSWANAFQTAPAQEFQLPDGAVNAEMMTQTGRFEYAQGVGYQAIDLPYVGGTSMTILLPDAGQFDSFEASLSAGEVQTILGGLQSTEVHVTMPQFECRTQVDLAGVLSGMGMPDAFDGNANFSGMSPVPLSITHVIHEAWIKVDKDGTEAAAATAVTVGCTCVIGTPAPPPVEFTADRPFIYMIRDSATGSILFIGRVSDASVLTTAGSSTGQGDPDPTGPANPVGPTPVAPPVYLPYPLVSPPVGPLAVADAPAPPIVAHTAVDTRALMVDALQSAQPALALGLAAEGLGQDAAVPTPWPGLATRIGVLDALPDQDPLQADWLVSALKDLGASRLTPGLAIPV